jgi:signal transduction histidine kinase
MGLFPVQLENEGLRDALKQLAQQAARLSGIPCVFRGGAGAAVPQTVDAIHLYRIAQEAVNNAAKHARASRIEIQLRRQGGQLVLTVCDNGIGLPKRRQHRAGLGLQTMRYRAGLLGARINWEPAPDGGTVVCVRYRVGQIRKPA